jgi:ribonuclease HI
MNLLTAENVDIKQLLIDIKFLQSELMIKFNEFQKYYPLMIVNKVNDEDVKETKNSKENTDMSIIYVDGCCNSDTINCAWGSVVNKNKVDLIPIYKHLSKDFKYLDLSKLQISENKKLQISKNIKNEVIIAKTTDVISQHNNYAELLSFLFALRISKENINVKEIKSDSELVIKYWSNPNHNTKIPKDKEKHKYILESKELRKIFEKRGGIITKISGNDNLADLGYHI